MSQRTQRDLRTQRNQVRGEIESPTERKTLHESEGFFLYIQVTVPDPVQGMNKTGIDFSRSKPFPVLSILLLVCKFWNKKK